jgi:ATP-dependent RNA helicase MSS116
MLFSATIPAEVHSIANLALLPNHAFISTLTEEDRSFFPSPLAAISS